MIDRLHHPLLILDLDETLISASATEPESSWDFRACGYYVTKRPHLEIFLASVSCWFDLAVWTSSGQDYAAAIVDAVFPDRENLAFVWTYARCTQRYDGDTGEPYTIKDLKKVKKKGYSISRVLMIDDSAENLTRNYGNHLQLTAFEGNAEDRELLDVLPFLSWMRTQSDFRRIEKRDWRS